ncbi:sigma factor [Oceanobacillus polygoni]|uniref:RNA polymerase sigma-70 factor (ECF subfamily) n=1 Tax=Oceanobacillus polygoni TaxID=1235259 RepID=A0A9X1CLL3_9BACI|nr:sigma factor [Oceanobacillus polygoni]MBP2079917.1 RNA polymerase sigma-70 factor (ECF subfamily) [Oceanobacillus polygoni]
MREIGIRAIKQLKKGDYGAFKKVVDHYHQAVYHICYMILGDNKNAEELAKDTFLHVFNDRDNCQAIDKKFSLWLFQQTIDLAQKRFGMNWCTIFSEFPEEDLKILFMHVSLKERLALTLRSRNQLSVDEISKVLETPNTEIVSYIWQGREKIRKLMR